VRALCPDCQQIAQCFTLCSANSKLEGFLLVELVCCRLEAPGGCPLVQELVGFQKSTNAHGHHQALDSDSPRSV
ncbi:2997_t:CDS:2, partial [Dentiscutata erythropus]